MNKCLIYQRCGGCQLLHLEYAQTLELKKKRVFEAFKAFNQVIVFDQVVGAKNPYAYRNKMQITLQNQNQRIVGGFYEENTHKVVGLDTCLMHSDMQNALAKGIVALCNTFKLKAYDEDRKTGLLRHILIKEAFATGQIMVVLVVAQDMFPARGNLVKAIRQQFPQVTTIIQNVNPRKTSIVLGEKERILFGKGYIEDALLGYRFKITPKSFYQVNPVQTTNLYNLVQKYANIQRTDVVIDAYSGVGTIGMILSGKASAVICVESNRSAVHAAIANVKDNNIRNLRVICDDATHFLETIANDKEHFDVLVMDPPRSGATERFLQAVLKAKPKRIVYVSCDVDTLVRDLALLKEKYDILKVSVVDMFSWTEHIESVVSLALK